MVGSILPTATSLLTPPPPPSLLCPGQLVAAHRTACLRADDYGQAVALNLLLRSYIAANEYALAQVRGGSPGCVASLGT